MTDSLFEKWQGLQTQLQTSFSQMPDLLTTDWQALHFLRPEWFYGFLPLALLLLVMVRKSQNNRHWQKVCDAQLLPHILTSQKGKNSYLPALITLLAGSLCLIALAGPVLKKLPQPVFREQSALVILLDLSQSMNVQDIKPSRIERAKLELLDILERRRGGQSALIVYAADAFTVTPLTDDNATIANLVPSLETSMMPAQGSRLDIALKKAKSLFTQAGLTSGDILIISDDIQSSYKQTIKDVAASGFRVSVFAIGTPEGGPIPLSNGFLKDKSGAIVVPKLATSKLQEMALSGHGLYVTIDASEQDTVLLTDLFESSFIDKNTKKPPNASNNLQTNMHADVWQEEGIWLLLPLLFLAALWARKGWLVLLVALTILSDTSPVYAQENTDPAKLLNNLWLTPNQQGMQAFNHDEYKKAADAFKQPDWKASALYRNADFEQAAKLFEKASDSDAFYNKGNALAKAGLFEQAIAAYDKALELNADNQDAAYNKALVENALKKQQEEQKKQEQSDETDSDNSEEQDQQEADESEQKDGENKQSEENKNDQQDNQDSTDKENSNQQQNQKQPSSGEQKPEDESKQQNNSEEQTKQDNKQQDESLKQRNPDDQDSKAEKQEQEQLKQDELKQEEQNPQTENNDENNEQNKNPPAQVEEINPREASVSEDQQAIEQWLRRIQDDPGGLLRRKFLYQYKNVPNQKDSDQPW